MDEGLYIVSTPIGNLEDITLRALKTLKECDIIACENPHITKALLSHYQIGQKKLITYEDHQAHKTRPYLIELLKQHKAIALVSDAGTPLISDPGYKLVKECYTHAIPVHVIPGCSSTIAALTLAAQPTDRFMFCGFINPKTIKEFQTIPSTLIFFEAPHRFLKTMQLLQDTFPNRTCSVAREITKLYEEVTVGTFEEITQHYEKKTSIKGEFVIVLSPPFKEKELNEKTFSELLNDIPETLSLKDKAAYIAKQLGLSKRIVYQKLLHQDDNEESD